MAQTGDETEKSENYIKLKKHGINEKVITKLEEIYKSGKLSHEDLDERAFDALKEFPVDGVLKILDQFLESNLEHVLNKSAFLCGIMKTYKQKSRSGSNTFAPIKGPNEDKIKEILDRTGYTLEVSTGQRKYGGPPPGWQGSEPGKDSVIFCGKIPKDIFEDELIPLFEKCGVIWDLRLMMDPIAGTNRGYAFVTFTTRDAAERAVQELDNYEIAPGKTLKINISAPNARLFIGNIPKSKSKEEIMEIFSKLTVGLREVFIYNSPDDIKKNRGFCFLEYDSHKTASLAKRYLSMGRVKVWGCQLLVDWADPQEEPDEQTMSKVKVLYVRNLTQETSEDMLKKAFEEHGVVERVKKIKDYAFVHFKERNDAVKAMDALKGKQLGGSSIEISLAKPPSDKMKREEILKARERRLMQMAHLRGSLMIPPLLTARGGQRNGHISPAIPRSGSSSSFEYNYDYYEYEEPRAAYYDEYYPYDDYYDYPPQIPPPPPQTARGRTRLPPQSAVAERGRTNGLPPPPPVRGGKRKHFESSYPADPKLKRRYQSSWTSHPLETTYVNGERQSWYQDSYKTWG